MRPDGRSTLDEAADQLDQELVAAWPSWPPETRAGVVELRGTLRRLLRAANVDPDSDLVRLAWSLASASARPEGRERLAFWAAGPSAAIPGLKG